MADGTAVRIEDGIAWLALDDGKVNAMSTEMMAGIEAALDAAERAGAVTVLSGRPGIFSAGFDLPTFKRGLAATAEMLLAGARLIERLLAFPLPVLTVCTGHAYPMGAFLMLSADVRLGASGPWRIGMNEVAIGLTVPKFAIELARHRLTPPGFARITTAPMFAPDEALRLGYLDASWTRTRSPMPRARRRRASARSTWRASRRQGARQRARARAVSAAVDAEIVQKQEAGQRAEAEVVEVVEVVDAEVVAASTPTTKFRSRSCPDPPRSGPPDRLRVVVKPNSVSSTVASPMPKPEPDVRLELLRQDEVLRVRSKASDVDVEVVGARVPLELEGLLEVGLRREVRVEAVARERVGGAGVVEVDAVVVEVLERVREPGAHRESVAGVILRPGRCRCQDDQREQSCTNHSNSLPWVQLPPGRVARPGRDSEPRIPRVPAGRLSLQVLPP
jgi:enoyl-CoA hydratase